MIKSNYMESQAKIKIPTKHRLNIAETPVLGNAESLRQSIAGGQANNVTGTPNISSINMGSNMADDTIKLYGKDDIFNFELSPHQIETELLCSERLLF